MWKGKREPGQGPESQANFYVNEKGSNGTADRGKKRLTIRKNRSVYLKLEKNGGGNPSK